MIKRIALNASPLPLALKATDIRFYALILVSVALNVAVPWLFHQFHLAGATFLPMQIFALVAALGFGWQIGLAVGLLTPLASYAVSGMPLASILPQATAELAVYGLLAGVMRHKLNLKLIPSLLGAMVGGRLALLLAVVAVSIVTGKVFSPLGPETTPLASVWHTMKLSWPGMLLQLALIPAAFWATGRFFKKQGS